MIIKTDTLFYVVIVLLSVLFLFAGNRIASRGMYEVDDEFAQDYYMARVSTIISRTEEESWMGDATIIEILFTARLTGGGRRGETVVAMQLASEYYAVLEREVKPGDRIVLLYDAFGDKYDMATFVRINHIIVLGVVFLGLVLLFARKKGFNALLALGFTCLSIFLVFIPALLSGKNIYVSALVVCLFSIISTLSIVVGPRKKTWAAMAGCLGGVLLAAALMLLMDNILSLTGSLDTEARMLLFLPVEPPLSLPAIVFAGVILGAVGAIMDVAMSISTSLWELHEAGNITDFRSLVRSGMNIGKDILGTMLNTLILAYIGSSLALMLLIAGQSMSFVRVFSNEMIIVEFLRALVGSFGMLLAIPLTAVICGWLFSRPQLPASGGDITAQTAADGSGDADLG